MGRRDDFVAPGSRIPTPTLRSWSYRRQLLCRAGTDPLATLRDVVGVYSTHPTAPLALLARCAFAPEEFLALEQRRQMIRIPGMRQSIFLVPADTAAVLFAATRRALEHHAQRLRFAGLDFESYARLTPKVLECAATPVTPAELRACTASDEDVYMVARVLAREGRILRVGKSLRTDQLKYVATEAWLGHPLDECDPPQALAWLAGEYLRAFGPASAADFAWWAGVTRRAASAALSLLTTVAFGDLLLLEGDADAFDRVPPIDPAAVDVLPKWDSYTMAYAPDRRQRLVEDRFLSRAYTAVAGSPGATAGDGLPLVLRGGRAVASWSHRFTANRLQVSVSPFEIDALSDASFERVGELLGAANVEVTRVT